MCVFGYCCTRSTKQEIVTFFCDQWYFLNLLLCQNRSRMLQYLGPREWRDWWPYHWLLQRVGNVSKLHNLLIIVGDYRLFTQSLIYQLLCSLVQKWSEWSALFLNYAERYSSDFLCNAIGQQTSVISICYTSVIGSVSCHSLPLGGKKSYYIWLYLCFYFLFYSNLICSIPCY